MSKVSSLILLIAVQSFCFAGDKVEMTAGHLRKQCAELRESGVADQLSEVILAEFAGYPDEEVIGFDADWHMFLERQLAWWRLEKQKTPLRRKIEGLLGR